MLVTVSDGMAKPMPVESPSPASRAAAVGRPIT